MAGRTSRSKHGDPKAAGDTSVARAADEQPGALKIDTILDTLEGIVEELEGGELPLEAALERFERGVTLARRGSEMLDALEMRVEQLLTDPEAVGGTRTAPFATTTADAAESGAAPTRRIAPGSNPTLSKRSAARLQDENEDDSDDEDDNGDHL